MIEFLAHLGLLVVQHDEVAVGDVEAGEVIDGGLGVVDVLVDDEGGAASVLARADSDLPNGAVLAEYVVHLFARYVERQVPNVEYAVHLRWQPRVSLAKAYARHCWLLGFWPFQAEDSREWRRVCRIWIFFASLYVAIGLWS